MVLFKEDWKKIKGVSLHMETTNDTWIRIAALFKYMKIDNHAFMLAIHNPLLKNVDPRDENNLTEKEKILVAEEALLNPWYYFREIALVPSKAGNAKILFKANRANISVLWLFFNHITQLLIQIRQTGKSLTLNELFGYLLNTRTSNTDLSHITKDDKLRNKASVEVREIISLLPEYLQMITKNDIKNSERITCRALKNVLNIYVGRTDKKAADNLGRGMTTPVVEIDEIFYVPNIHITLPTLLSATVAAREVAQENGADYGTILTSTAGKLNTTEGKFGKKMYDGALRWSEKFFDLENREKLVEVIKKNSNVEGGMEIILLEYNHRQLGETDEWLKERISAALSSGENAESDFFNKWIGSGTDSPFDKETSMIIESSLIKESRVEVSDGGYVLRWYVSVSRLNEILNRGYLVISTDTSDAAGNDDISLTITSSLSGEVLAAGKFNETNLIMYADFLIYLIERFNNSITVIERKSSGVTIMDYMVMILISKNINPFKKLFNLGIDDYEKYKNIKELFGKKAPSLEIATKYKSLLGFTTTGSGKTSRNVLYGNVFSNVLKYVGDKIRDKDTIDQFLGLVIRNERIDHPIGGHDDMVVSLLMSFWILSLAKNKKMYDIRNPETTLSKAVDSNMKNKGMTNEEIRKEESMRRHIMHLLDLLKREDNEFIAMKIVMKIRTIEEKMSKKISNTLDIDNVIREFKIYDKLSKVIK